MLFHNTFSITLNIWCKITKNKVPIIHPSIIMFLEISTPETTVMAHLWIVHSTLM